MTQYAKVKKILPEGKALVSVIRESSCGKNCASCGGCSEKNVEVNAIADNLCDACEGDLVSVETPTSEVLRLVCAVYLLPTLLMIALCITASALGASEGVTIICGALGLGVSFFIIRAINNALSKKRPTLNVVAVIRSSK